MRVILKYVLVGIIFVIFFFFGDIIVNLFDNGRGCKKLEKIYVDTYDINGVVKFKFNDPDNHRVRTLRILNKGNKQDFTFQADIQGFYGFVLEGDSILKKAGDDTLKVFREGSVIIFMIDLNCKPYKMPPIKDVIDSKFKKWF